MFVLDVAWEANNYRDPSFICCDIYYQCRSFPPHEVLRHNSVYLRILPGAEMEPTDPGLWFQPPTWCEHLLLKEGNAEREGVFACFFICNVQPFRSKIHKLQGNAVYLREFREACAIAPVETLDFSKSYQAWSELSGNREKHRGKGVYLYINRRWCSNITVRKQLCLLDAELLSVLLRPSCRPWEFPQIFVLVVYTSVPELTPK